MFHIWVLTSPFANEFILEVAFPTFVVLVDEGVSLLIDIHDGLQYVGIFVSGYPVVVLAS